MPATIPATCNTNEKAARRWATKLRANPGPDSAVARGHAVTGKTIATALTLGIVREVVETLTVAGYEWGTIRTVERRYYEAV